MFLIRLFYCSQELEDHTDEVTLQHEVLDGMFTFYDSTRASLNVYQVIFFILFYIIKRIRKVPTLIVTSLDRCFISCAKLWDGQGTSKHLPD